jgi:ribosome-binding protein aMBF1 (putative translation factor)
MPSKPDLSDAFAQIVARHRQAQKLSKATLAERAGLHQTYIGLLEKGQRSPNLDTAKAIARALGISLADLIEEAEKAQKRH